MYTKEQKILRFSMILLFLALMIVYIVWYQLKGNELKKEWEEDIPSDIQVLTMVGDDEIITDENVFGTGSEQITTTTTTTGTTGATSIEGVTGTIQKHDGIKMLSGTSIYYGKINIIEQLGIKYQYALIDSTGTRFIYLGTPSYDFASIARALKGNIYTITTEKEIIENKLFGKKIIFINIPEYKDKNVIILIYMNDGIWLIQIDYSIYHKSKPYLKSLFID